MPFEHDDDRKNNDDSGSNSDNVGEYRGDRFSTDTARKDDDDRGKKTR